MAVYVPHKMVKITALPKYVLLLNNFLYMARPSRFFDYFTNATDDGGCFGLSRKKMTSSAQMQVMTIFCTSVIRASTAKQASLSVLSNPAAIIPLIVSPTTLPTAIDKPIKPVAVAL